MFVRPVTGEDDLFAFQYGFALEGKALEGSEPLVEELDNGDLIIEGYAAVFDGVDRSGENFAPGAFEAGVKAFLGGQSALCYHHKHDHVIGSVLDMREEEGKGLKMRARVDNQPESSPLRWIYNGIKKGSIRGLSVGGFFKRGMTELGRRITGVDFTEVSTTGVPVHPGTSFAVVAGKALEDIEIPAKPAVAGEIRAEDEEAISYLIETLGGIFARIEKRGQGQQTRPATTSAD